MHDGDFSMSKNRGKVRLAQLQSDDTVKNVSKNSRMKDITASNDFWASETNRMQLVTETAEPEQKFTVDFDPPAFLNSVEEIKEIIGEDRFNALKSIVEDQKKNRDIYFTRLMDLK